MTKERILEIQEKRFEEKRFHDPTKLDIYTEETKPYRDQEGRMVVAHAPEVRYEVASRMWEEKNQEMNETIVRENFQIVIVNPDERNITGTLLSSFRSKNLGNSDIAFTQAFPFEDNEKDLCPQREDLKSNHVYLVASTSTYEKYADLASAAFHYKYELNTPYVTLIATYLGHGRQDKNASDSSGYNGKIINIGARLYSLAPFIDRAYVFEPHSYATPGFAAAAGIPLAPISPWQEVTERLFEEMSKRQLGNPLDNPDGFVIAGPDIGRNMAATRISQKYGITMVSGEKVRISETQTEIQFPHEQAQYIYGRFAFCYDDEVSSFGTGESLMQALEADGARGFAMAGIHTKLTNEWDRIMKNPFLEFLLLTDSRTPVTDDERIKANSKKIVFHSLVESTKRIIEIDVAGINPWEDNRYSPMILQERK